MILYHHNKKPTQSRRGRENDIKKSVQKKSARIFKTAKYLPFKK
jgi:hypothetical protein